MKIVLRILGVVAAVIALVLIVAIFTKKEYVVERDISINRPNQQVFDYVKLLKNQDHYNKWVMTNPNMKKDFRGTDGTVGFVYAWDGNEQAGAGEQEILNIVEGQRIDAEIRFVRPFKGLANTTTQTIAEGDQTKVKWSFNGKMPYPFNAMALFVNMDKHLGKDMEIGLQNLKKILESR
jgi:uncharacterized membrane protein